MSFRNLLLLVQIILLVSLSNTRSFAQENKSFKHQFSTKIENDVFFVAHTDRYYTSGIFFRYQNSLDNKYGLGNKVEKALFALEIAQKIFTPFSIKNGDSTKIDRPFAGYLFVKGETDILLKNEQRISAGLSLGLIGPSSQAENFQKSYHALLDLATPHGWQYQISNTFVFNADASYSIPLIKNPGENRVFDLTSDSYINIGTAFNGAGTGLQLRAGSMEKLFQSEINNARISSDKNSTFNKKTEFFFYTKPMINYILYDATIQGNLFKEPKPLEIRQNIVPWVYSQELGVVSSRPRWGVNFHYTFTTHESEKANYHTYGSLKLNYRFK